MSTIIRCPNQVCFRVARLPSIFITEKANPNKPCSQYIWHYILFIAVAMEEQKSKPRSWVQLTHSMLVFLKCSNVMKDKKRWTVRSTYLDFRMEGGKQIQYNLDLGQGKLQLEKKWNMTVLVCGTSGCCICIIIHCECQRDNDCSLGHWSSRECYSMCTTVLG